MRWPKRAEAGPAVATAGGVPPGAGVAWRGLVMLLMLVGLQAGPGRVLAGPASAASADGAAPVITAAQQRWLAAHAPVRFGPERDYGPFVYQQADGRLDGLSVEMLRLVQQRTGMALLEQPAAPLHELLAAARARQLDLLSSLRPTPERAQFLRFTQPYVSVPAVLVRRAGDVVRTLPELAGVPVAVGRGYAAEAVMRQRHPAVRWVPVSDDGQALAALLRGEVQAVVADAASVAFVMRTRGLQGLRLDAPVGFEYTLSFAVRDDWPELVEIINRAIQHIGPRERQRVLERWLATAAAPPPPPGRALRALGWGLGLLALSLVLAAGLWLRRRRRAARPAAAPAQRPDGHA